MIWTIKLLLVVGATVTYAENTNSVRQDTSFSNETKNSNSVEVAEGVKLTVGATNQLDKPAHIDVTSTSVALSPNVTAPNVTQIANSNSTSINNTSSTSSTSTTTTTTTTTTTAAPPKILINYDFTKENKTNSAARNSTTTTTTEKVIPVNEFEMGEKNDHKMSVAKKGFQMNETGELLSSTTTTSRPKKPTLTVGNEDTVDTISNNAIRINTDAINISINLPPVARKTDYIVPIVGVILSVPIVAILMNLVYRKTKDWWQYRHYKRMDLIDGIYNN